MKISSAHSRSSTVCLLLALLTLVTPLLGADTSGKNQRLTILVTDPLSKDLACACVAGFAQRRYEALTMLLERRLHRACGHVSGTSLGTYWDDDSPVHLIIGKYSEVLHQAKQLGRKVEPIASLTDKQGSTTFRGLYIVRQENPARTLGDLQGYRILFGPEACDEKHAAAKATLDAAHIAIAAEGAGETAATCTDAANRLMALDSSEKVAAVISDYAQVLLEGCHAVPPGSIRVVGKTEPVPFVTVFATEDLPEDQREVVKQELLAANQFTSLLRLLETKEGFVPFKETPAKPTVQGNDAQQQAWVDFRGPDRNGLVASLPDSLDEMRRVWTAALDENGLGGVAVTDRWVIATDRVLARDGDVLKIFDAATGEQFAKADLMRPPSLQPDKPLDYGNSVRTTPVVQDGKIYVLDAYGTLFVHDLPTDETLRQDELVLGTRLAALAPDFKLATWGVSATPLVLDDKLVVNICGEHTSLLALDREDLTVAWQGDGSGTGYASCLLGEFSGRRQVVGYESKSISGWDAETGERLWNVIPEYDGDFNVPTPVAVDSRTLLLATENNGMRLYDFLDDGRLADPPRAVNEDVLPDTVSPIAVNGFAYCTSGDTLFQLSLADDLKETWSLRDDSLLGHASLLADRDGRRLLVLTYNAELLLLDIAGAEPKLLSRQRVFDAGADEEVYSHPAIVGDRLYVRGTKSLVCIEW